MADLDLLLLRRRMDRLLAPYDRADMPGMALGLVRDGALVLHRQAGMASLELGVPLGVDSCFRIASVSKQFTCAAILLLAAEGKLDVRDAARTYLPELAEFGAPLTIAHLMHNTSGLRDMLELMRLGGMDLSVPCTTEDLLAAIFRQRTLNFAPGSRYLYSNSNFLLLGVIVERIAGEALPGFLERRIFAPLGMSRTRMTPSTTAVVAGLATGYLPKDGGWVRAAHGFPLGGEGGLVSSVEDLALWARNCETGRVGGMALVEGLETQQAFTNGAPATYARGLQVRDYRGMRAVDHGGLWPGYKTEFLRVPELRLAVICIANNGAADPYHTAHDLLDAAIEGRPGVHAVPALPPRAELDRLAGRWLDRERGTTLEISVSADGVPGGTANGVPFRLKMGDDGRLAASRSAADFCCALSQDGSRLEVEFDARATASFERPAPGAVLPEGLAGAYENAELAAIWTFAAGAAGMEVRVAGPLFADRAWEVEPIEGDCIRVLQPGSLFRSWSDVRVLREGGRVSGLQVTGGRARELMFLRLA